MFVALIRKQSVIVTKARQLSISCGKTNHASQLDSVGLKVNYSKSMLVPINVEENRTSLLAQLFGCVVGSLPFTYLGLPLCLTKPKVNDFLPLVIKCERRLAFTSSFFLSEAGRLEVTNSIFTPFSMFFLSSFRLHKTVIKRVDSY